MESRNHDKNGATPKSHMSRTKLNSSKMKKHIGLFSMAIMITILIIPTSCKNKDEAVHPYTIGQSYGGGIIFYIDATWQHGLICATSDQGAMPWGCDLTLIGGTSYSIGTGLANTTAILNKCSSTANAASICDQYSVKVGDVIYDDWFLPSIDELNQIFRENIFTPNYNVNYWSSSEVSNVAMRVSNGNFELVKTASKEVTCSVRAIRAF